MAFLLSIQSARKVAFRCGTRFVLELWQKASLRYAFCAPICRSRGFCGRVSRRVLYCCETAAARETERRAKGERWVSLPLTTFFRVSSRKKV